MSTTGHWIVRISLVLNASLILLLLNEFYPKSLQSAASTLFSFEGNLQLEVWSLNLVVVGVATLLAFSSIAMISSHARSSL